MGFCHFDLAVRFVATKSLISEDKMLTGLEGFRLGVAAFTAYRRIPMNVEVAISMSSHVSRFIVVLILTRTSDL